MHYIHLPHPATQSSHRAQASGAHVRSAIPPVQQVTGIPHARVPDIKRESPALPATPHGAGFRTPVRESQPTALSATPVADKLDRRFHEDKMYETMFRGTGRWTPNSTSKTPRSPSQTPRVKRGISRTPRMEELSDDDIPEFVWKHGGHWKPKGLAS
jgi:hypothetical protein